MTEMSIKIVKMTPYRKVGEGRAGKRRGSD
jgi:hypothetical protein